MSKKLEQHEQQGLDDDMEGNWALEIDLYTRQGSVKVNYHCSYHEHVLLRLLSRVQTVEIGAEWRVVLPWPFAVFFFRAHFSMRRSRLGQANFHTNITLYKLHILNTFENDLRYDDVFQNILKTTTS